MENSITDFRYYDESGNEIEILFDVKLSESTLLTQSFEKHFGIEMKKIPGGDWLFHSGQTFTIKGMSGMEILHYDVRIEKK